MTTKALDMDALRQQFQEEQEESQGQKTCKHQPLRNRGGPGQMKGSGQKGRGPGEQGHRGQKHRHFQGGCEHSVK